jgi:hypothetical protein
MFFLVVPLHVVFNQRQPIEPGIKRRSDHESTRVLALCVIIKSNEDGGVLRGLIFSILVLSGGEPKQQSFSSPSQPAAEKKKTTEELQATATTPKKLSLPQSPSGR